MQQAVFHINKYPTELYCVAVIKWFAVYTIFILVAMVSPKWSFSPPRSVVGFFPLFLKNILKE